MDATKQAANLMVNLPCVADRAGRAYTEAELERQYLAAGGDVALFEAAVSTLRSQGWLELVGAYLYATPGYYAAAQKRLRREAAHRARVSAAKQLLRAEGYAL